MAVSAALALRPARLSRPALSPRIAVGLATRGRPESVRLVVDLLRRQTLRPAAILVACVEPGDVAGLAFDADLTLVACAPGLTRQRNAILDRLPPEAEFVVFFDDDFLPHEAWLAQSLAYFDAHPEVAGVTGHVIANGVKGGAIPAHAALAWLAEARADEHDWSEDGYSPYGCNMAFRRAAIEGLSFDERLVRYGWLEDRDFGAQVQRRGGRLARLGSALGVHLAAESGRMNARGLGYAQIANPLHLLRKGTMSLRLFFARVLFDLASNLTKAPRSAARRARLLGNLAAIGEALIGRCQPERAGRY